MTVVPFVHEGLGNSSFLVSTDGGNAFLVDPDRSVERYLREAEMRGWTIRHVFETHLHADFVSGALEVRAATGAELLVPAAGEVRFRHRPLRPGDTVSAGGASVTAIASPGHTPEHTSYLLRGDGIETALFSGGSLLVGGAARTDLIAPEVTDRLSRSQFRTITGAFDALTDQTLLYPTHGGGSFCSTGSGGRRVSTLGIERLTNPLLKCVSEDQFASWFPSTFPAAPSYFFRLRPINQQGPRLRSHIPRPPALEPPEFDRLRSHAVVVDVRLQADFMAGHIPGSMSNTFRDAFATWVGWLVPDGTKLLFVLGDEPLDRVLDECLLVGYEHFGGVLAGGMDAWRAAGLATVEGSLAGVLGARRLLLEGATALDVREPNEFAEGHIPHALHIPLGGLERRAAELPRDRPIVTYCGHGERSATAFSLLERLGFGPLANFDGGFGAWQQAGLEVER